VSDEDEIRLKLMLGESSSKWERFGAKYVSTNTQKIAKMRQKKEIMTQLWSKSYISGHPATGKGWQTQQKGRRHVKQAKNKRFR